VNWDGEWRMRDLRDGALHLEVAVRSERIVDYSEVVELQERLASRLDKSVALVLSVIPSTRLDPIVPPTPTATATATPSSTPTRTPPPTHTPIPTPTPVLAEVGGTGGEGVWMYRQPGLGDDKITAWPDGTVMIIVGGPVEADGYTWIQVVDPKEHLGWLPERYLIYRGHPPP
jgi:hypothetical protein